MKKTMSAKFIYRTFKTINDADYIYEKLTTLLLEKGYIQKGISNSIRYFQYPSLLFSTKQPLTCISSLTFEVIECNGCSKVKFGATFTKIKYYTIFIMILFCIIIPSLIGIMQHGIPDVPPMAFMGIPLGFMVYYHVRSRVFKTLRRYIECFGGQK